MKSSEVSKKVYKYAEALEALNRLLYANGRKGVSIKETDELFVKYKIPKQDWHDVLKRSALKYL